MIAAETFVDLLGTYEALGVVFAIVFVMRGINRVDPVAQNSGIGFKIIILPGVAALWPLLLRRWMEQRRQV